MDIKSSKSPNLPVAVDDYSRRYQDQLNNLLRMYFTELDSNTQQLVQATNNMSVMQWLGDLI